MVEPPGTIVPGGHFVGAVRNYASGGRVSPASSVEGRKAIRPAVNELDPDRPPPRKRAEKDPIERALLALEGSNAEPDAKMPAGQTSNVSFEYIKKMADAAGLDIGNRIDQALLSSVGNDPSKHIEIRSDPKKYAEFQKGENQEPSGPDKAPERAKKASSPTSMPATQAQPPRAKR